jgi:hypothetical protein
MFCHDNPAYMGGSFKLRSLPGQPFSSLIYYSCIFFTISIKKLLQNIYISFFHKKIQNLIYQINQSFSITVIKANHLANEVIFRGELHCPR